MEQKKQDELMEEYKKHIDASVELAKELGFSVLTIDTLGNIQTNKEDAKEVAGIIALVMLVSEPFCHAVSIALRATFVGFWNYMGGKSILSEDLDKKIQEEENDEDKEK